MTRTPLLSAFWICLSAWLSCAGWGLSAVHQLNAIGYVAMLLLGAVLCLLAWKSGALKDFQPPSLHRLRHRVFKPLPLGFFILAALAFVGGALYLPANYDALAYRTPRVLHWLAEGKWHWIHTDFARINTRACAFEWLTAPLIALTRTDRLFFLINIFSFLLLPGLVFSVFTRVGVRRKVAWCWMWIVPGGYCFVLQAGSIGNDLLPAMYALAAVDFALRARTSGRCVELWISLLAAALMTGAKASNLPLLLPWLVAAAPALPLAFRKLPATLLVCILAAGASFLPMAALNLKYSGDWAGRTVEGAPMGGSNHFICLTWNALLIPTQNLVPPVFPWASAWNRSARNFLPVSLVKKAEETFESGGRNLSVGDMQVEEGAGLGLGVCLLLMMSFAAALTKSVQKTTVAYHFAGRVVLAAAVIAVLVFMAKSGLSTVARLLTPYYALLLPALLLSPAHERIVKAGWWKCAAAVVFLVAAMLVIVQPPRPLWPALFTLEKLQARHVAPSLIDRAHAVYAVYRARGDAFAPARELLPPDANPLGIITADDPETSLWRPFGSRRILHVKDTDMNDSISGRQIRYVLISGEKLAAMSHMDVKDWIAEHHAEVLKTIPLRLRVTKSGDPQHSSLLDWTLVRMPNIL